MSAKASWFAFILLFALLPACAARAQENREPTAEIAIQQLLSSDYKTRFRGLVDYIRISVAERTPAMKSALVQALASENERIRQNLSDDGSAVYKDHGTAEAALELVHQVSELRDPTTIQVLLPWMCCGWDDEFIDFGRQALEPVLIFVETGPPAMETAIGGGLRTLRMMVDHWRLPTFSASERTRMKQVAADYINGNGHVDDWPELRNAIELAASLEERELLSLARTIVNDEAALSKRKIMPSSRTRDLLKQTATMALAGTLDLRQYRPYEQRKRR